MHRPSQPAKGVDATGCTKAHRELSSHTGIGIVSDQKACKVSRVASGVTGIGGGGRGGGGVIVRRMARRGGRGVGGDGIPAARRKGAGYAGAEEGGWRRGVAGGWRGAFHGQGRVRGVDEG